MAKVRNQHMDMLIMYVQAGNELHFRKDGVTYVAYHDDGFFAVYNLALGKARRAIYAKATLWTVLFGIMLDYTQEDYDEDMAWVMSRLVTTV